MKPLLYRIQKKLKKYKTWQLGIAFILFWTPVVVFLKITGEIIERQPIKIDMSILGFVHSQTSPALDKIFLFFTTIGNVEYILPITLVLLTYLLYKRRRHSALILFFGVGGAAAANIVLKSLFHRDRPVFWQSLITETGYSFPSGHAMLSAALVLCVVAIVWRTKWRLPTIIIGGLVVFMIGLSRLYLGVHYPTDVIAGWSVSAIWIGIVVIVVHGVLYEYYKKRLVIFTTNTKNSKPSNSSRSQ